MNARPAAPETKGAESVAELRTFARACRLVPGAAATATEVATRTATAAPAAAAAKTTATTAAKAAAAAGALFLRPGDIDSQRPAIQRGAVHGLDRRFGFLGRAHGDEGKPAGTARGAIQHEVHLDDRAVRRKSVLEVVLRCVEGKISYKQFRVH